MGLTNISNRLTPSDPTEVTFGSQVVATGTKIATLTGHKNASALNAKQISTVSGITGAPVTGTVYSLEVELSFFPFSYSVYTYTAIAADTWLIVFNALRTAILADATALVVPTIAGGNLVLTAITQINELTIILGQPLELQYATVQRGPTGADYLVYQVQSVGDADVARLEVDRLAGTGSEAGKMAKAFVSANSKVSSGARPYPPFRVCLLPNAEAAFGPNQEALVAMQGMRNDFLVGPYEASNKPNLTLLTGLASFISGPDRTMNGQFGTTAVAATQSASATALAINANNVFLMIPWQLDTSMTLAQTVGEIAAAFCASVMQLQSPYLGLDGVEIGALKIPTKVSDRIVVGASELSELALVAGLCPLTYDSSGIVRIVRSRLTRVTLADGVTPATAYIDWQDVIPLYDFREDFYNSMQQTQFKNQRNTSDPAFSTNLTGKIKSEAIRIALLFEKATMFQYVSQLAPKFVVQPNATERGRNDVFLPVDVVPILHVIATNIQGMVFVATA